MCWTGASVVPFPFPLLMQVSAQNWDHNDKFPQFNGPHATLPQGYQVLFQRLADQLNVHYRTPVTRVEVTEEGRAESCRVTDSHGEVWLADKVSRSCFCQCLSYPSAYVNVPTVVCRYVYICMYVCVCVCVCDVCVCVCVCVFCMRVLCVSVLHVCVCVFACVCCVYVCLACVCCVYVCFPCVCCVCVFCMRVLCVCVFCMRVLCVCVFCMRVLCVCVLHGCVCVF